MPVAVTVPAQPALGRIQKNLSSVLSSLKKVPHGSRARTARCNLPLEGFDHIIGRERLQQDSPTDRVTEVMTSVPTDHGCTVQRVEDAPDAAGRRGARLVTV